MARAVAVCFAIMFRPVCRICDPRFRIIRVHVPLIALFREPALRLGPQTRDRSRGVIEIYRKAVGLIMGFHEAEDIVVDIAEEVDIWLDAPVVFQIFEGRVVWEEARVPAAHLVVGDFVCVLDFFFAQDFCGFGVEVLVYPRGDFPVFAGNELEVDFGFCFCADGALEVGGEEFVVEEGPGVVEFVVEGAFEVAH